MFSPTFNEVLELNNIKVDIISPNEYYVELEKDSQITYISTYLFWNFSSVMKKRKMLTENRDIFYSKIGDDTFYFHKK